MLLTTLQAEYREIRPSVYLRKSLNNPLIDRVRIALIVTRINCELTQCVFVLVQFRSVLVEYFAGSSTPIKKPEVFALIASKVPDAAPTEADYNRIMKELATYNGTRQS